ncbi:hypothetical protein [Wolbachia endosymbiont of Folsomia candida]|uniref:hypothetical protein n=1 Tax=Wolbachia endosymbiont of Folsomia candida TaxID=169402 RepID=UPI000AC73298|nr:hypothetical protein [Wolbachia endosymbiont of Folsomia candida]APR98846.1 hypothetical protein ASM33_06520 [Wolbachia endosymbiont of Folsomia candida]
MPSSKQQFKEYKNRLLKILHNMQTQNELHSGPALDLHNDLAELRSIGIKTDIPNLPPLNLDSIYRQNSRCKVGSKEFKLTIILISETIKNIDTQINNMQFASIRRSGKNVLQQSQSREEGPISFNEHIDALQKKQNDVQQKLVDLKNQKRFMSSKDYENQKSRLKSQLRDIIKEKWSSFIAKNIENVKEK